MKNRTVHLAHDWLVGLRGGEWVLDRLARLYGPTALYTLVSDGRSLTSAIDACDVRTSFLQRLPAAHGKLRRWYFPLMMRAVDSLAVESCDVLLSTSSAVMKSIQPPQGVPHLCYCHSPARYIWGQTDDYTHGAGGGLRRVGLNAMRRRFQEWDARTASRVTKFLANSRHTADKIKRWYDREATVVFPPVRTEYFTPDRNAPREPWYLVVSALEPYKRVDLAIETANRLRLPLKIVGTGSQSRRLQGVAGPTVEMLGRVDDGQLRTLYRDARALIHPQREDFGIIAVEAQACGCPVIAFAAGGALETVTGASGVFFEEQTVDALADAIKRLDVASIEPQHCRGSAERFSESRFDEAIRREVRMALGERPTVEVEPRDAVRNATRRETPQPLRPS